MTATDHWTTAADLALDVPATGQERHAWTTRNLCELALALEVGNGPKSLLDTIVLSTPLSMTPHRLARRLAGIRERWGSTPEYYPAGAPARADAPGLTAKDRVAIRKLFDFASALSNVPDESPRLTALGGRGADAVHERAQWRPFPAPAQPHNFIEVDVPVDLVWRAWLSLPDRPPTRIVNDERLSAGDFDIWWGVHDGSHLDHLAVFPPNEPAPIEYGRGLLVTESLVMSLELLAAAEALVDGDLVPQARVRAGILERIGRVSGTFADPVMSQQASNMGVQRDVEFSALPTLARAYVTGALAMITSGFADALIPASVADDLRDRWAHLDRSHPAIAALTGRGDS